MTAIPTTYSWARGRPISVHTIGAAGFFRYNGGVLLMAVLMLGIGGLLLGVHFGRGPQTNTLIPGLIFAALAIPLVIWAIVRFQGLIHEVRLYPAGVLWSQAVKWRGWLWEEIEQVYRTEVRVNGGISTKHVVLASGGKKVTLQYALSRWDRMAEVIQMETTNRLLPYARENYAVGETVDFRKVAISEHGLTIERKEIAFGDIKSIELTNGMLLVYPQGRRSDPRTAVLGDIPNYLVLLKLLEESPAPPVRVQGR
jgi:hypothetical protein